MTKFSFIKLNAWVSQTYNLLGKSYKWSIKMVGILQGFSTNCLVVLDQELQKWWISYSLLCVWIKCLQGCASNLYWYWT